MYCYRRLLAGFNNIWKSKQISHKTKLNILKTCMFSTALYACEAWTLKKTDRDQILAFEMYCYRRLLQINWTLKLTNGEIRKRINIKKRFNASSDEKEVGIIRTCMQNEKQQKNQRRHDGDDGGNWEARKTMQRMDGRHNDPANQTSSILRQIDVVLIGISWIIGLTSGTDVGPMSEKHIELTSEADFGPMSDKPLSDEFR